jgi:1-acyl-sn-glycerol-3-phosphate acyltransferase
MTCRNFISLSLCLPHPRCPFPAALWLASETWDDVGVGYWITKYTLGVVLKIVFRPRAWGVKNVPRRGPVILASNHLSFSDHFFGPLPVPRKVIFLAKSEYFTGRGLKGLISKAFFAGVGQIPIDRAGGAAGEQALRTGLQVLAAGRVLGIYPEGTRSPDGRLYRGKTGVARLAIESGAPVVPCAMIGTFEFQPPSTIWPNFRVRPGVKFGEPLDFSRYHGEADAMLLRTVTDEIMQAIAKLSGQEYVDIDARRAKAEMAAAASRGSAHVGRRDGQRQDDANQGDEGKRDGNGAA